MVIFNCLKGLVFGIVGGIVGWLVVNIVVQIVGGIVLWDTNAGVRLGNSVSPICLLLGPIIGLTIAIIKESKRIATRVAEERRQRAAQEAEERRQREKREAQQQRERDQAASELERQKNHLASLLATTQRDFLSLPELVPSADTHLDGAEHEFADGAFAPFWDEVELAANKLAAYHEGVRRTSQNASDYERHASKLSISIPKFSLPEGELPDARPVAQRLSQIVRTAQKNFQFATIYEQRKTNQLLYAGFGTLGAAISTLGSALTSSLQELSESVHSSLDDILQTTRDQIESTRDQTYMMECISEQQAEKLQEYQDAMESRASSEAELRSTEAKARRKYEEKRLAAEEEQTKMLDNIQRRRKPFP